MCIKQNTRKLFALAPALFARAFCIAFSSFGCRCLKRPCSPTKLSCLYVGVLVHQQKMLRACVCVCTRLVLFHCLLDYLLHRFLTCILAYLRTHLHTHLLAWLLASLLPNLRYLPTLSKTALLPALSTVCWAMPPVAPEAVLGSKVGSHLFLSGSAPWIFQKKLQQHVFRSISQNEGT